MENVSSKRLSSQIVNCLTFLALPGKQFDSKLIVDIGSGQASQYECGDTQVRPRASARALG